MILNFNQYSKSKELTVVSVVEDRDYFLWQQEIQSNFMRERFSHLNFEVIVLYEGESPSKWAKHLESLGNVNYYKITEDFYKSYKASYKPLGIHYRINDDSKKALKNILAIDSDVILNRDLEYPSILEGKSWIMSDCNGYLGYKYLTDNLSESRINELAKIVGITHEQIKSIKIAGGAQYLYKNVSTYKTLFEKMAKDSIKLYEKLKQIQENDKSDIQIWTAEMWSQLWNAKISTNVIVHESMNFCMAGDSIDEMKTTAFTHFAGNPENGSFAKTKHQNPFIEDLSYVTNEKNCAWHWKCLIEKYKDRAYSNNINKNLNENLSQSKIKRIEYTIS